MPLDTTYHGYMLPDMFTHYGKSEEFLENKRAMMVAEQQRAQQLRQQQEQTKLMNQRLSLQEEQQQERTNLMSRRLDLQQQGNILRGNQLENLRLAIQYRLKEQAFRQKQEADAIKAADDWNHYLDSLNSPIQGWQTQVFPNLGGGMPPAGPNPSGSADKGDLDLNAVFDLFGDEWQPND